MERTQVGRRKGRDKRAKHKKSPQVSPPKRLKKGCVLPEKALLCCRRFSGEGGGPRAHGA